MIAGSIPGFLLSGGHSSRSFFLGQVTFFATLVLNFFVWLTKWRSHSIIGKYGSIFGIGQHGEFCHLPAISTSTTSTYITPIQHGTMDATSIGATHHQFYENYFDASFSSHLYVAI